MELGALAGLAACAGKVDQLDLFVFDNGLYESGGGGPSRFFELDWEALFQAFGLSISVVDTDEQLSRRLSAGDYRGGVRCTVVQVANEGPVPRPRGEIDGRAKAVQFAERIVAHSGRSNWRRAEKL
jgi:hypothetical protein